MYGEGPIAMAVGAVLLLGGLYPLLRDALRGTAAPTTSRRSIQAAICRLWGRMLLVLGFLFWCCPQPWGIPVLLAFGGGLAVTLLLHWLLWR